MFIKYAPIFFISLEVILIICGIWSYLTAGKNKGTKYAMSVSDDKRISTYVIDIGIVLLLITIGIILYNADLSKSIISKIAVAGAILLVVMILVLCVLLSLKKSSSFEFNALSISLVVLGFALAVSLIIAGFKKPEYGYESQSESSDKKGFYGSDGKYHEYIPEFGDDVNEWMEENW